MENPMDPPNDVEATAPSSIYLPWKSIDHAIKNAEAHRHALLQHMYAEGLVTTDRNVQLRSGETSRLYFNLRNIILYPAALNAAVATAGPELQKFGPLHILCGAGGAANSIVACLSSVYDIPHVILREVPKTHGIAREIIGGVGTANAPLQCILIDDVLTTGGTLKEYVARLASQHIKVIGIVVIVNRSKAPFVDKISGIPVNSVFDLCDFADIMPPDELLRHIQLTKRTKLCLSIDGPMSNIERYLDLCGKYLCAVKLHPDLIVDFKPDQLSRLALKHKVMLIADMKYADIQHIVRCNILRWELQKWANFVTVHLVAGDGPIRAIVDVIGAKRHVGCLIVANMSCDPGVVQYHQVNPDDISAVVAKFTSTRVSFGVVSQKRFAEFLTMTPGVALAAHANENQQYREITEVDADVYIVGRAITGISGVVSITDRNFDPLKVQLNASAMARASFDSKS